MTLAAALTTRLPRRLGLTFPQHVLRSICCGGLLLASYGLVAPAPLAAQVEVEQVELNAHIDAHFQALYAKAKLVLRNRGREMRTAIELTFPAPLGPRIQVKSVWDRRGELSWHLESVEEEEPRRLLLALRSPLAPGKKHAVVMSFDVDLQNFSLPEAAVVVLPEGARLRTTGWYPVPADSDAAVPRRLRLVVRLPKQWPVVAPVELKPLRNGTALASYQLELKQVEPDKLLLLAGTALRP